MIKFLQKQLSDTHDKMDEALEHQQIFKDAGVNGGRASMIYKEIAYLKGYLDALQLTFVAYNLKLKYERGLQKNGKN